MTGADALFVIVPPISTKVNAAVPKLSIMEVAYSYSSTLSLLLCHAGIKLHQPSQPPTGRYIRPDWGSMDNCTVQALAL